MITPAWACCNEVECLGNYGTCIDYLSKGCYGGQIDLQYCSIGFGTILSWSHSLPIPHLSEERKVALFFALLRLTFFPSSSANPSCFKYARVASLGALTTYYSWACGQSGGIMSALATPTGNGGGGISTKAQQNPTSLFTSPPTGVGTAPTDIPRGSGPGNSNPGKTSLSTGAIVGISVVGLIALVVLLVFGYFCCRKRERKAAGRILHPPPPNPPYIPTTYGYPNSERNPIPSWMSDIPPGAPPNAQPVPPASVFGGTTLYSR